MVQELGLGFAPVGLVVGGKRRRLVRGFAPYVFV